jgi:hypothetical protein
VKILLDSSGWIEFFTGGPLADRYSGYFSSRYEIITPTIVLYEVYKKTSGGVASGYVEDGFEGRTKLGA